jgi:starvation-inducible outer membrane lipoprotein
MKLKTIAAALALAMLPLAAQAQSAPKITKADAQKVVKMIGADKAKTKAYCEMAKLGDEMDAADKKKDTKKVEALSKKMDALTDQLGPDYGKLMQGMEGLKPDSKQAQEIGGVLDGLDKLCGK